MKKATNSTLTHGENRFPKDPHFYDENFILASLIAHSNKIEMSKTKRFNVSSHPQYNYGYHRALEIRRLHQDRLTLHVHNIQSKSNNNVTYAISQCDSAIINDPNTYFRRIPTPDDYSQSAVSDNSYTSAKSDITAIYLPSTSKE
ncbi:hypothetical protein RhiirA4_467829 [Rhizophagus irregularis]|uniref:Uncharacterized protein n=1 Tax=Rhizophagus irregularis TaxID=588596 RepID=A0A2I1GWN0_9GLOM|nr:hypothetical protein RhiirA4_467829 [Rhizophagus irregularis]